MKPIFWLRRRERWSSFMPRTSTPSSQYSPPVKSSSRPAMLRKVVLPEPDGPVTATNSPSRTWIEKSRNACVSTIWVRYTLERCDIFSMTASWFSVFAGWMQETGSGLRIGRRQTSLVSRLSVQNHFRRAVEGIGAGNHDAVAFLDAGEKLDCVQTGRADLDRRALGDAVAHDVGDAAGAGIDERTAVDHQHVRMLVDQDARRQTLALAQAGRLLVAEAHARDDLAVDDFRRYRRQRTGIFFRTFLDLRRHADRKVVREHFGHLQFDFERGQVDHAEQSGIRRNVGLLLHEQLADLAGYRRAYLELVDLALQFADQQLLLLERIALGLELERQRFVEQLGIGLRMRDIELGLGQRILRAQ